MFSVLENYNISNEDFKHLNLKDLAIFVLESKCKKKDACASINFISKDKIHKLNKEYRGIDRPTDVLSFECDSIDDDFVVNSDSVFELGDIFVCAEVAKQNALNLNTSLESELKLLIVHGMLHLCGYDHIDENDAVLMEKTEEEILDAWDKK